MAAYGTNAGLAAAAMKTSWTAYAITSAVGFGVGIVGAAATGAAIQAGQIATGRRDKFDLKEWGNYIVNNGIIGGAVGIGLGTAFKVGGQQFAKWAAASAGSTSKWGQAFNKFATYFASNTDEALAANNDWMGSKGLGHHMSKAVSAQAIDMASDAAPLQIFSLAVNFGAKAAYWASWYDCETGTSCAALRTIGVAFGAVGGHAAAGNYDPSMYTVGEAFVHDIGFEFFVLGNTCTGNGGNTYCGKGADGSNFGTWDKFGAGPACQNGDSDGICH